MPPAAAAGHDRRRRLPARRGLVLKAAARVADALAVRRVQWAQACRIVPTRHPSVYLFDRVADAKDFDALYALEALTNDRIRDETGVVQLVAPQDRVFGPGSGPIMAAFTHVNPAGSRFSDGAYGMFYAARERATAVAETAYHHARFLAATNEGPMHLPMRLYHVTVDARLHDLRNAAVVSAAVFDPSDYTAARALGAALHARGSVGVVYRSVRRSTGSCVGLFKPRGARACVQAAVLLYAWNGQRFTDIYEKVDAA
jgi:RES domain-containing protein